LSCKGQNSLFCFINEKRRNEHREKNSEDYGELEGNVLHNELWFPYRIIIQHLCRFVKEKMKKRAYFFLHRKSMSYVESIENQQVTANGRKP